MSIALVALLTKTLLRKSVATLAPHNPRASQVQIQMQFSLERAKSTQMQSLSWRRHPCNSSWDYSALNVTPSLAIVLKPPKPRHPNWSTSNMILLFVSGIVLCGYPIWGLWEILYVLCSGKDRFKIFFSLSLSTTFGGTRVEARSPYTLLLANLNTLMAPLIFVFLSGAGDHQLPLCLSLCLTVSLCLSLRISPQENY